MPTILLREIQFTIHTFRANKQALEAEKDAAGAEIENSKHWRSSFAEIRGGFIRIGCSKSKLRNFLNQAG